MNTKQLTIKCISLWQPWSTLVAIGAKRFETRSWYTGHRGPLLIHAAKRKDHDSLALCFEEPFKSALVAGGIEKPGDMPFGAIIAICRLAECRPTIRSIGLIGEIERAFGDYGDGRYAWRLADVQAIEPIPYSGLQGLFGVPSGVIREAVGCAAWTAHPSFKGLFDEAAQ